MGMLDIFEKLKSLQAILVRKYELESKIEEAPKRLGSQDELLARMRKEFIEKNKEYEEIKEKVYSLRIELEETVKTREAGEKNMDNITTHREYEALEKQISEASAKEADVRKELQKQEKNLAELNDILKSTEAMIESQDNELKNSKASLDEELNSYKNELDDLKQQETGIIPGLDQEILFKFERIIQRNSDGIVAVKNGVCTGCHMILPGQYANEVREGENILFCPYCSRILYYEEADENSQESYFSIDDAGSLADLDDDDFDEDFGDSDEDEELELNDNEDSADDLSDDDDSDDDSDN